MRARSDGRTARGQGAGRVREADRVRKHGPGSGDVAAGGDCGVFVVEEDVPRGVARGGWVLDAVVVDVFRVFEGGQGRVDGAHAESKGAFHEGWHVGESVEHAGES